MRQFLVAVTFVLATVTSVAAQTSYGFHLGIGSGWLRGEDTDSDEHTGLILGAHLVSPLGEHVAFRPMLSYMDKGGSESFPDVTCFGLSVCEPLGTADLSTPFVQISAPIHVSTGGRFGMGVLAGPWLAFRVGCTATLTTYLSSVSESCPDTQTDELGTVDIGGVGGLIFTFRISDRMSFGIDGTVNFGLKDMGGDTKTMFMAGRSSLTIHP